ncbi:MAG: hypothetical protein ABH807_02415 [Candidatus Shapirobacteria bacterium]
MAFSELKELSAPKMAEMWEKQGWNGENPHKADFSPLVLNLANLVVLRGKAREYQERNDGLVAAARMSHAAPELKWQIRGRTGLADYAYNAMRVAIIEKIIDKKVVDVEDFGDLVTQAENAGFDNAEFVYYFGQAWGVVGAYNNGQTERLYQR